LQLSLAALLCLEERLHDKHCLQCDVVDDDFQMTDNTIGNDNDDVPLKQKKRFPLRNPKQSVKLSSLQANRSSHYFYQQVGVHSHRLDFEHIILGSG